jgi:hypothetical protein
MTWFFCPMGLLSCLLTIMALYLPLNRTVHHTQIPRSDVCGHHDTPYSQISSFVLPTRRKGGPKNNESSRLKN